MSQEIVYTSAPKGLKPGSRGFCTVVSTDGMAGNLADRLESHSGYRHAFGVNDDRREFNPVNWSHTTMRVAGTQFHVLSRVADAGLDYSGRSNKFAHHVALDVSELPMVGPARTLLAPGVIRTEWSGEVGLVARRKLPEIAIPRSYQAATWRRVAGDPAWAGVVAEKLLESNLPLSIIFPLGADTMSLLTEVLDLLPLKQRWSLSFSTYFTQLAPGTECRLRFILDDTPEAVALRKNPHAAVIDLVRNAVVPAGGELVACARSSQVPEHSLPPSPKLANPALEKQSGQAQSRRESRRDSVEEVYEADWDESEDTGEYAVRHPDRSTADVDDQARRARRRRADEMPVRPPIKLRTIWIASGVCLGLVLFLCVAALLLQRFRASGPTDGKVVSIAGVNAPPKPPGPTTVQRSPQVTSRDFPESGRETDESGIGKWRSSKGNQASVSNTSIRSPDGMKAGIPEGKAEIAQANSLPANPMPTAAPAVVKPDPFEKLPRDKKDNRLAVLALPEVTDTKPISWELAIQSPADLDLTLLGSDVLMSPKQGLFTLTRDQSDKSKTIWKVNLKIVEGGSDIPLGEFSLVGAKGSSQLFFQWSRQASAAEIELVPQLTLGLSSGKSTILCRLSEVTPVPTLSCEFQESAFISTPILDFRSQILGSRIVQSGSSFFMDISLPPELCKDGKYSFERLSHVRLDSKETFDIPLAVVPEVTDAELFKCFQSDGSLASIKIKPLVSDTSLSLEITASAHIVIYDRSDLMDIEKKSTTFEDYTAPASFTSGLSVTGNLFKNRLHEGMASNVLTPLITKTIANLRKIGAQRDSKINVKNSEKASAKPEDRASIEKDIESLNKLQESLVVVVNKYEFQLKRHDIQSFRMLRRLLLGDKPTDDHAKSIRGIVNAAKIGVRIGYEQEFEGQKYLIVIAEASK